MFDSEVGHYQHALEEAGYITTLEYKEESMPGGRMGERKKHRSRNIIWYNPPYSNNVKEIPDYPKEALSPII